MNHEKSIIKEKKTQTTPSKIFFKNFRHPFKEGESFSFTNLSVNQSHTLHVLSHS